MELPGGNWQFEPIRRIGCGIWLSAPVVTRCTPIVLKSCYNGGMQPRIVVRDSCLEDLQHLDRIRAHADVRPHQFRVLPSDASAWRRWIEINARVGDLWFRCSTIVGDQQVIGYVSQTLYFAGAEPYAECGWNLHPTHWGRGIMKVALREILQRLFTEQEMSYVTADCFSNNSRCKKLLSKLHFSRIDVPLIERIRMAYQHRCLHWIERYSIDRAAWKVFHKSNLP